ncbi:pyridoxal phosphate-dependent aminotransferase [Aggregatilineales bacterium SYSU G02658]
MSAVSHDTPVYAVDAQYLIGVDDYPAKMTPIPPSRMFTIKKALDAYKAKVGQDAPVYDASQGDGGASLPGVPSQLLESALELQIKQGTGYDQPFGTPLFRKVAAENYWKLDAASGWTPANIIFVQGGRDGLNKAYNAMVTLGHGRVGDVLLVSRVPWISYNWGPYGLGLNVLQAPGDPADGWRYTPEGIRAAVAFAARDGRKIAGVVITSPDNPTGRTIPLDEQIMLGKVALEAGVAFVLYDWIYHWVSDGGPYDINTVLQAFTPEERERLMFLDGLTKSLGASNIRSAQLLAGKAVVDHIVSQASHGVVPSFFGQAVAIAAYQQGFGEAARSIIEPCAQSRQVMKRMLKDSGLPYVLGDGYYAFIDVTRYIEAAGYASSEQLGGYVAEEYGVAVVPGAYFSDAGANWVRFSYALPPEKTEKALQQFMAGLQSLLK